MNNYKTRLVASLAVSLMVPISLFTALPAQASAPVTEMITTGSTTPTTATTTYAVPREKPRVSEDSLDTWLTRLGKYESENNPNAKVLDVNGKYSYGCLQFQMGTWLSYGKSFGATEENIYDCDLQRAVARNMILTKYSNWKHWSYTVSVRMRELPPVL